MAGLRVTEEELKALLVTRLEVIDEAGFNKARQIAAQLRIPLERALMERGRIPFGFLLEQIAQAWGVRFIDLKVSDVKPEALRTVGENYARAHTLVPFHREDKQLRIAMWDPRDLRVIDGIERMTGLRVVPHLAPEPAIRRAHLLYKDDLREMLERSGAEETLTVARTRRPGEEDGSAVELLDRLLKYAAVVQASDIHIEPYQLEALVRYRIDGVLHEVLSLPPTALPSFVARIKILSGMRIDERRAPQDGRFEADLGGFNVEFRVSSLPTQWGEKIVLRVLSKDSVHLDLEDLGLVAADYQIVLRNFLRPFGLILLTGPTGSGKTTTLYAAIIRLGAERQNVVNITTIEDPVEYTIPRVNQVPLNPAAGVEFSSGLRTLLRQDPDVIMVGEIRDRETAEIAVRAALVGRLLLSTLHTNDTTGAVPRLLDMGVEPFLLASTLALVIAQRLVRRVCVDCRESMAPGGSILKALRARPDFDETIRVLQEQGVLGTGNDPLSKIRMFQGKGCLQCNWSGFRGRLGVFELFEVDDQIREMIMERKDASSIRAARLARGMKTMFQDGLAKALLGETTLEEVFRVAL
jgi:type II secretory ATPase GspE/PulE/Tfp pilus assembly ATPase PilB-like protein